MKVRRGYIYALLLAIGLLLWTEALDLAQGREQSSVRVVQGPHSQEEAPWDSAEAVYACAMKAEECGLSLERMHVADTVMQGNMTLTGAREHLQTFYTWLETEGRFRAILAMQMETEDETRSKLSISYQL